MRLNLLLVALLALSAVHAHTHRGADVNGSSHGSPKGTHDTAVTWRSGASAPAPRPSRASRTRRPLNWAALARCESGGNPRAVSPTGRYRGAFQFDLPTWRGMGGHGDPAAASYAEQVRRAARLYAARGRAPWPVCGGRL